MNRLARLNDYWFMSKVCEYGEKFAEKISDAFFNFVLDYGKPYCPFWRNLDRSIFWGEILEKLGNKKNSLLKKLNELNGEENE